MPPTGFEFYEGQATWQKFLEDCCTGQNFEWEVEFRRKVENGIVWTESKTWMDFTRELGVAPNDWHEVFIGRRRPDHRLLVSHHRGGAGRV